MQRFMSPLQFLKKKTFVVYEQKFNVIFVPINLKSLGNSPCVEVMKMWKFEKLDVASNVHIALLKSTIC